MPQRSESRHKRVKVQFEYLRGRRCNATEDTGPIGLLGAYLCTGRRIEEMPIQGVGTKKQMKGGCGGGTVAPCTSQRRRHGQQMPRAEAINATKLLASTDKLAEIQTSGDKSNSQTVEPVAKEGSWGASKFFGAANGNTQHTQRHIMCAG